MYQTSPAGCNPIGSILLNFLNLSPITAELTMLCIVLYCIVLIFTHHTDIGHAIYTKQ